MSKKYILLDPGTYERQMIRNIDKTPVEKKISEMDVEIRSILDSQDPDDIKAGKYAQALNKLRFVTKSTAPIQIRVQDEDILDSISNTVRHKARRLLDNIKENTEL